MRWDIPFNAPQGWYCPGCGKIYSPQHHECEDCNRKLKEKPYGEPPQFTAEGNGNA